VDATGFVEQRGADLEARVRRMRPIPHSARCGKQSFKRLHQRSFT
jgi:hypothetical protein